MMRAQGRRRRGRARALYASSSSPSVRPRAAQTDRQHCLCARLSPYIQCSLCTARLASGIRPDTLLCNVDARNLQIVVPNRSGHELLRCLARGEVETHVLCAAAEATYDPLLELAKRVPDTKPMFGSKEEVDPVRFLIGSEFGWGGLPAEEAYYLNVNPELPVGEYEITVKDVPVDAFWSISVYNKDGYFEKNDLDVYSVNSISGKPNDDGSFTVYLGGCDDGRVNCIPLTEGWNYAVRLYEPRPEILDGTWTFPSAQPVKK
jgi:Protein of unknown function (DUF1214)